MFVYVLAVVRHPPCFPMQGALVYTCVGAGVTWVRAIAPVSPLSPFLLGLSPVRCYRGYRCLLEGGYLCL